jgi:catechol 2,3-dioxygenase-like lactoylglutathione lyase family enzyme
VRPAPALRVARATNDLARLVPFYRDGLGFEIVGSFDDHAGFDGIMFGRRDVPYHFEFTSERGASCEREPHPDDLIVLYLPDRDVWEDAVARMEAAGFAPVAAHNPYWDRDGRTYADPDGNRVVLQNAAWR